MEREVDGVASAAGTSIADGLTLETARATIAELKDDYARLWRSYEQLIEELALIKRRMFIATAERVDTTQLQLEFEELVKKLNALSGEPDAASEQADGKPEGEGKPQSGDTSRDRPSPKGAASSKRLVCPRFPSKLTHSRVCRRRPPAHGQQSERVGSA
jgi:hypothetical protein